MLALPVNYTPTPYLDENSCKNVFDSHHFSFQVFKYNFINTILPVLQLKHSNWRRHILGHA